MGKQKEPTMKVWLCYTVTCDFNGTEKVLERAFDSRSKALEWIKDPKFKESYNSDYYWRECEEFLVE
jgi:hypothetical protein